MNFFLRELINRVISYLIRVSKGETYEEKIEQLLKKALLFAAMALILSATMTSKWLVAGWYLDDLESSFGKIDTFMGTQQENMNQLFRINGDQYNTIVKLEKENKSMLSDIRFLLANQKQLEEENEKLKAKQKKGK
ncbi:hypothetical protein OBP_260 [Pseudomonas phage OBP]|uniref:hypothetical protein n=1 Tax=Pseudomonas phage OBP TaxID=1124849 RepID=UPI000240D5ED|nr:hypothetical protein OBP_260 [Pseudomonas phage OBP]AEV89697.1 hypothetical protein OBP_260 [Pseudomonas phage OBP]